MAVRIISAVVAIPLLLFFVIVGGLPLRCAVSVVSLIGIYELYKAVSGEIKTVHIAGFLAAIIYFAIDMSITDNYELLFKMQKTLILLFVAIILAILVFNFKKVNIVDGTITFFGFAYLIMFFSIICEIRKYNYNMVWLPFIYAFGCDTGAYFIGSKFGRHKLCPELSPKKSVEGAVGGVVSAVIITAVYVLVYNRFFSGFSLKESIVIIAAGIVGAVLAQVGDLAASSIKRYAGIKDYGKIMPGHGGVLDRFDSVLLTIPWVYFLTIII